LLRRTKERLYNTYLCAKLTYACETFTNINGDDEMRLIIERKLLRKLYESVYNVVSREDLKKKTWHTKSLQQTEHLKFSKQ